jgi:hypothetical protein
MELAYIVSAYKYPEQLVRLISKLDHPAVSFFVHIDLKSPDSVFRKAVEGTRHLPNVHFLKRYRCYWGGFGHVQATLEGLDDLFRQDIPFEYAILLTGQDYPIKSNEYILDFFHRNRGQSFLHHFPLPTDEWEDTGLARLENWHLRWFGRHLVIPGKIVPGLRRSLPKGLQAYGGSSYWCLYRDSVEYIHRFVHQYPDYTNFFKTVDVPDEIFFQTIVMNSPQAESVVNDDLRYMEWRDPNAGSPAVLRLTDIENLLHSPKLFARKFDASIDAQALDRIDRALELAGEAK